MKLFWRVQLIGLFFSLIGCASTPVDSNYTKDFSFRSLRTFDWLPQDMGATGHNLTDTRLDVVTKNALRRELTARFYRHQVMGTPDFWVNYRMGPVDRAKAGKTRKDQEPGPLEVIDPLETPQLGPSDFMLEFIDPRSQRVIWRAWGQNLIPATGQPLSKKMVKKVEFAVQTILQRFPPR